MPDHGGRSARDQEPTATSPSAGRGGNRPTRATVPPKEDPLPRHAQGKARARWAGMKEPMQAKTPSAQQMRFLLPDLALHFDKLEMLTQLRPLHLDINRHDDDDVMHIELSNDYTLVLTAGEASSTDASSWVFSVPATTFPGASLEETLALAITERITHRTTRVPAFTAYVRLENAWDPDALPVSHYLVQSPDPVEMVEDALTWCRHASGLPLRWKHVGSVGAA